MKHHLNIVTNRSGELSCLQTFIDCATKGNWCHLNINCTRIFHT